MEQRKLKIRDLTLRDGQQSLFATRFEPGRNRQAPALLRKRRLLHHGSMGRRSARLRHALPRRITVEPPAQCVRSHERQITAFRPIARPQPFGYVPYPDYVLEGFYKGSYRQRS